MKIWTVLAALGALLNVADAILTIRALDAGLATEGNPIMAVLITVSIPLFYLYKLGIVGLFGLLWFSANDQYLAKAGIVVGCGSYVGIVSYHLLGLFVS